VLWVRRGTAAPAELVKSLSRHGASVETCQDLYSAMARACRGTQAGRAMSSGGRSPGVARGSIVLLVEPTRLEGSAEFVEAVRRYAPRCAVWWYDPAQKPSLRAVTSDDIRSWRAPAPAAAFRLPGTGLTSTVWTGPNLAGLGTGGGMLTNGAAPVAQPAGPRLKLTESAPEAMSRVEVKPAPAAAEITASDGLGAAIPGDPDAAGQVRDLLTPEELSMLLDEIGPLLDDHGTGPRGSGPRDSSGHGGALP